MRRAVLAALGWLAAGGAAAQTQDVTPPPSGWVKRPGFDIAALDKVTARNTKISGKVGETVEFGSLRIAVSNCVVRPPDQAADAAAWLDIIDTHPAQPEFHGWMVASAPFVSMLQHPLYDVRVIGCHA